MEKTNPTTPTIRAAGKGEANVLEPPFDGAGVGPSSAETAIAMTIKQAARIQALEHAILMKNRFDKKEWPTEFFFIVF